MTVLVILVTMAILFPKHFIRISHLAVLSQMEINNCKHEIVQGKCVQSINCYTIQFSSKMILSILCLFYYNAIVIAGNYHSMKTESHPPYLPPTN